MTEAGRRRAPRTQLLRAHPRLEAVSPEPGAFDEDAMYALLAEEPDAAAALLVDLAGAYDPVLRARARALAGRLAIRSARDARSWRRGVGQIVSRAGPHEGDLDVDASIERAGGRPRRAEDLVVRGWMAPDQATVLCIDRSGSMAGTQVLIAATAAAGVLLAAEGRTRAGVLAFGSEAVVLRRIDERRPVSVVVDDILSLRGHGVTDLGLALRTAAQELTGAGRSTRVAIVLSDVIATTGSDPRHAARGIDHVHVLGTSEAPESVAAGRALAKAGGGRHRVVTDLHSLAPALTALLT